MVFGWKEWTGKHRTHPGKSRGKTRVKLNAISSYFLKYQQCILHSGGDKDEKTLTLPSKSYIRDFPGGAVIKNLPGDQGLIPGLGRSPGEGNGNPLQYSCLGNPMDGGVSLATIHGVTKSQTQLSKWAHTPTHTHTHTHTVIMLRPSHTVSAQKCVPYYKDCCCCYVNNNADCFIKQVNRITAPFQQIIKNSSIPAGPRGLVNCEANPCVLPQLRVEKWHLLHAVILSNINVS